MATLNQVVKGSKELEQISAQIKNVALFFAPKKTGNLKRRMNQANKPAKMFKIKGSPQKQTIAFSLNIAPDGAKYGKFWNRPNLSSTVEGGKTKNVPRSIDFGKQAMNDPSVKKELAKFYKEFAADYAKLLVKELKF